MKTSLLLSPITAGLMFVVGCATVKVEPIEVKEIHIVHDVNIKVDKQLDEFFAFQDQQPTTQHSIPTTQTSSAPRTSIEGEIR